MDIWEYVKGATERRHLLSQLNSNGLNNRVLDLEAICICILRGSRHYCAIAPRD